MNAICRSVCTKTEWVLNGAILKVLFKIQRMGIAFDLWHVSGDVIAFDLRPGDVIPMSDVIAFDLWPGDVIPMSDVIAFDLGLVVFGSWTRPVFFFLINFLLLENMQIVSVNCQSYMFPPFPDSIVQLYSIRKTKTKQNKQKVYTVFAGRYQ